MICDDEAEHVVAHVAAMHAWLLQVRRKVCRRNVRSSNFAERDVADAKSGSGAQVKMQSEINDRITGTSKSRSEFKQQFSAQSLL